MKQQPGVRALAKRPRVPMDEYKRLPLPWIAKPTEPGVHDKRKQRKAARESRCSTCGTVAKYPNLVFIISPNMIEWSERLQRWQHGMLSEEIIEPPQHPHCARMAVRLCPHLKKVLKAAPDSLQFAYVSGFEHGESSEGPSIESFGFASRIYRLENARTGELIWDESRGKQE